MVIMSEQREIRPVGGSNLAGTFQDSAAFAGFVLPKGRHLERDGTQRLQKSEYRALTAQPDALHEAAVAFTLVKEAYKPSRLKLACDEEARRLAAGPKSRAEQILKNSASLPALGSGAADTSASPSRPSQAQEQSSPAPFSTFSSRSSTAVVSAAANEFPEFYAGRTMNTRWYPHVCANRGSLKLSTPSSLMKGIDPLKDKGHSCPFWEGPKDRLAVASGVPEARPRTPTKSLKWRVDGEWDNPCNHATYKVTQSFRRTS